MHLATEISSSLGDQQAYRSAFPGHVLKTITNDIALNFRDAGNILALAHEVIV
jgi:hypothetical protein